MKFHFRILTGIHDVSYQETCQETNRKTCSFLSGNLSGNEQENTMFNFRKVTGIHDVSYQETCLETNRKT